MATNITLTQNPPELTDWNNSQQSVIAIELPKEQMAMLEIFTILHPVALDC